ncbi:MAG: hypothetical protein U5R31_02955 [Acidimicrobiia bacterium]|nr:hypothetical protein [Acidimicrobiia bacterium]
MTAIAATDEDLRWLAKAEHMGEWVRFAIEGDDEYIDVHGPRETIWLLKRGRSCRFYQVGKGQYGREHQSLVAACCWAWANDWLSAPPGRVVPDADHPAFAGWLEWQLRCRRWVLNGGAGHLDHLGDGGVVVGFEPEVAA